MNLEPLDLPPDAASRVRARARRVFDREAARARAPWWVRAEADFGRHVEPWLVAGWAVVLIAWATVTVG